MPRDTNYVQKADIFRTEFDKLLWEVILLSNGIVSDEVLNSGEIFTPFTVNAEIASSYYAGINLPTELTYREMNLMAENKVPPTDGLEEIIHSINEKTIELIDRFIQFKSIILTNVLSCKMFTLNYPLLIDHFLREAKIYLKMVKNLQYGKTINLEQQAVKQEICWNNIMAEHSKFARGLLDPTEQESIGKAYNFSNIFDELTKEAKDALDITTLFHDVTRDSLKATQEIRDFKSHGTQDLIECNIKSIIIPLLGDHTLREANHYLRLLKMFRSF